MKMTVINGAEVLHPSALDHYFRGGVKDSSCSPEARVYYCCEDDVFVKRAPRGALLREWQMTEYMHVKGLAPEPLVYLTEGEHDWTVTRRLFGSDLTADEYISRPKWLAEKLGEVLAELHSQDCSGCPVKNRTEEYLATAERGYAIGRFDPSYSEVPIKSAEEAIATVRREGGRLGQDTLIHGDACLPNVLFAQDRLAGFIDLGGGGVSDRHIDLYWGAWTLRYNLGTDGYRDRFFDAYGRDRIDPELIRTVSVIECFG